MAPIAEQTPLEFHCGVCARELTDTTCIFTSCGHFFCANARCTKLTKRSRGQRCEQCGKSCDAGTLEGKAAKLDDRARRFVFGNLEKDLEEITEILAFRKRHHKILRDRAANLVERNEELKQEVYEALKDKEKLEKDVLVLRNENAQLRKQLRRVVSGRSDENKLSVGDPNESLSKATTAGLPSTGPSTLHASSERYPRASLGVPSMRTETQVNLRNERFDGAAARMHYLRHRPVDPRKQPQPHPRRPEPVAERRFANDPTNSYRDFSRRTNNLTTYNSSKVPNASSTLTNVKSTRPSVTNTTAVQPAIRGTTLLKKKPTYSEHTSAHVRRGDASRSYGGPSTKLPPPVTDKLLRRSEPRPPGRIPLSNSTPMHSSSRIQRKSQNIQPATLSHFSSSRTAAGRVRKPLANSSLVRSTRANAPSWSTLPTVSKRLPKPTAVVEDWRKKNRKKPDRK